MSTPIITLLTDFGTIDEYVGVMKGVILSVNPDASIIDITHGIDPQDIQQAAYTIASAYRYFPTGSVHVVVVDPGVGSGRAILAFEKNGHTFLAPDNGVLTLVVEECSPDSVVRVMNERYFPGRVSRTFHGRDIFAPVGAYLSRGIPVCDLGTTIDSNQMVRLDIRKPYVSDNGELAGSVISIDRFGNLITNIDYHCLSRFCAPDKHRRLEIRIGQNRVMGLSDSYASADPKAPLAIIGSKGYLELAVNGGCAKRYFMAEKGDTVRAGCS